MPQSAHTGQATAKRSVRVVLLSKKEFVIHVENKGAKVQEIFQKACEHVEIKEAEFFGLALMKEGEFEFVAGDTKLHKLAPKIWKSKDCSVEEPLLTFYLRIQYYVDNIGLLRERSTRNEYYLQLRDNLLHYSQMVSEEKCFLLASYALQADYGDHNVATAPTVPPSTYFDPREFFPAWVVMRRGQDYITQNLPTFHKELCGMSRMDARVLYINDLSAAPSAHNFHFYRLRKRKYDNPGTVWLAICPKGIEIYEEVNNFKTLFSTFLWSDIGKLTCEKKKFEIIMDGGSSTGERRFTYYAVTKEWGQTLLELCRATHKFHLSLQPRLTELRHQEARDLRYRESYIHSENSEFTLNRTSQEGVSTPPGPARTGRDEVRGNSAPPTTHRAAFATSTPAAGGTAEELGRRTPTGIGGGSARFVRRLGLSPVSNYTIVDDDCNEILIVSPPQKSSTTASSTLTSVTLMSQEPSTMWTNESQLAQQSAIGASVADDTTGMLHTSNSSASLKALYQKMARGGSSRLVQSPASDTGVEGMRAVVTRNRADKDPTTVTVDDMNRTFVFSLPAAQSGAVPSVTRSNSAGAHTTMRPFIVSTESSTSVTRSSSSPNSSAGSGRLPLSLSRTPPPLSIAEPGGDRKRTNVFNAASLQRSLPHGTTLNDYITRIQQQQPQHQFKQQQQLQLIRQQLEQQQQLHLGQNQSSLNALQHQLQQRPATATVSRSNSLEQQRMLLSGLAAGKSRNTDSELSQYQLNVAAVSRKNSLEQQRLLLAADDAAAGNKPGNLRENRSTQRVYKEPTRKNSLEYSRETTTLANQNTGDSVTRSTSFHQPMSLYAGRLQRESELTGSVAAGELVPHERRDRESHARAISAERRVKFEEGNQYDGISGDRDQRESSRDATPVDAVIKKLLFAPMMKASSSPVARPVVPSSTSTSVVPRPGGTPEAGYTSQSVPDYHPPPSYGRSQQAPGNIPYVPLSPSTGLAISSSQPSRLKTPQSGNFNGSYSLHESMMSQSPSRAQTPAEARTVEVGGGYVEIVKPSFGSNEGFMTDDQLDMGADKSGQPHSDRAQSLGPPVGYHGGEWAPSDPGVHEDFDSRSLERYRPQLESYLISGRISQPNFDDGTSSRSSNAAVQQLIMLQKSLAIPLRQQLIMQQHAQKQQRQLQEDQQQQQQQRHDQIQEQIQHQQRQDLLHFQQQRQEQQRQDQQRQDQRQDQQRQDQRQDQQRQEQQRQEHLQLQRQEQQRQEQLQIQRQEQQRQEQLHLQQQRQEQQRQEQLQLQLQRQEQLQQQRQEHTEQQRQEHLQHEQLQQQFQQLQIQQLQAPQATNSQQQVYGSQQYHDTSIQQDLQLQGQLPGPTPQRLQQLQLTAQQKQLLQQALAAKQQRWEQQQKLAQLQQSASSQQSAAERVWQLQQEVQLQQQMLAMQQSANDSIATALASSAPLQQRQQLPQQLVPQQQQLVQQQLVQQQLPQQQQLVQHQLPQQSRLMQYQQQKPLQTLLQPQPFPAEYSIARRAPPDYDQVLGRTNNAVPSSSSMDTPPSSLISTPSPSTGLSLERNSRPGPILTPSQRLEMRQMLASLSPERALSLSPTSAQLMFALPPSSSNSGPPLYNSNTRQMATGDRNTRQMATVDSNGLGRESLRGRHEPTTVSSSHQVLGSSGESSRASDQLIEQVNRQNSDQSNGSSDNPHQVEPPNSTAGLTNQCLVHGNGLHMISRLRNFSSRNDSVSVPMLKALVHDKSLLSVCTCSDEQLKQRELLEQQQLEQQQLAFPAEQEQMKAAGRAIAERAAPQMSTAAPQLSYSQQISQQQQHALQQQMRQQQLNQQQQLLHEQQFEGRSDFNTQQQQLLQRQQLAQQQQRTMARQYSNESAPFHAHSPGERTNDYASFLTNESREFTDDEDSRRKRLSYSDQSSTSQLNYFSSQPPGSVMRPKSWHSEQFNGQLRQIFPDPTTSNDPQGQLMSNGYSHSPGRRVSKSGANAATGRSSSGQRLVHHSSDVSRKPPYMAYSLPPGQHGQSNSDTILPHNTVDSY